MVFLLVKISFQDSQNERPSFECLAIYSKLKGFSELEFETAELKEQPEECDKSIEKFSAKVREDIISKLTEISSEEEQKNCVKKTIENDESLLNNIIKGEALSLLESSDKISLKLNTVERNAENLITQIITSCYTHS